MLDLGGGPAPMPWQWQKRGVKAFIFDLPETIAIARKVARLEGVKGSTILPVTSTRMLSAQAMTSFC